MKTRKVRRKQWNRYVLRAIELEADSNTYGAPRWIERWYGRDTARWKREEDHRVHMRNRRIRMAAE